jgi:hypothetical protein
MPAFDHSRVSRPLLAEKPEKMPQTQIKYPAEGGPPGIVLDYG